jgi:hypothetical protein
MSCCNTKVYVIAIGRTGAMLFLIYAKDYGEPLKTSVFRGFLTPGENCICIILYISRN